MYDDYPFNISPPVFSSFLFSFFFFLLSLCLFHPLPLSYTFFSYSSLFPTFSFYFFLISSSSFSSSIFFARGVTLSFRSIILCGLFMRCFCWQIHYSCLVYPCEKRDCYSLLCFLFTSASIIVFVYDSKHSSVYRKMDRKTAIIRNGIQSQRFELVKISSSDGWINEMDVTGRLRLNSFSFYG